MIEGNQEEKITWWAEQRKENLKQTKHLQKPVNIPKDMKKLATIRE